MGFIHLVTVRTIETIEGTLSRLAVFAWVLSRPDRLSLRFMLIGRGGCTLGGLVSLLCFELVEDRRLEKMEGLRT
jgi:hypothetical protein